ncbi:hypothetical protein DYBT9623_05395 [Dyadobacter sp. CECT 9623]|uniref:DUF932 domain-containing protein n=1 Tax=Dyadobacter linearis TaxID=2823330 RepID=A0ABM8UYF4_9BACT|nr:MULTISPECIES: hypothetical protein [unclassified Dyadobacter]MCE7060254.1 hypothetical protein [Dyadobacter sp. CY343]CAG5074707.1 hypothetical protein DYBT9623_05395 [Dyadobacter sp. CECT 9623]
MTYISAQPLFSDQWDDICYPVNPVWLSDLLPEYDIMATDRQQLVVGEPVGGRKTIFGIQSADYTIVPNILIREVVDKLFGNRYSVEIKHTKTGEFSINIILPGELSIGKEKLQRSLILTNSYNGKTPFSVQGQTFTAMFNQDLTPASSLYRDICKNGLMGWADSFGELPAYQDWLLKPHTKDKKKPANAKNAQPKDAQKNQEVRKMHHAKQTPELFQKQLYDLLSKQIRPETTLTATIYEHFQQKTVGRTDENLFKKLPIPVQLAKQAHERLRLEERMLGTDTSYWLIYNAVNYALFNARSSLTLNDRYKLDEKVFHQLATSYFA